MTNSERDICSEGRVADKGLTACIGCGALVPDTDGPTHPYIGASPGCWALFGEVLAKEYGEYQYPGVHRLTVDAYAVQHPGAPSRRSIQSVASHLISLYCVVELGLQAPEANRALQRAARSRSLFIWLTPPVSRGVVTIVDVARAKDLAEHEQWVRLWATCVWQAWSPQHATVKGWAQQCLS